MGLFSRMFAARERVAEPPARKAPARKSPNKASAPRKTAAPPKTAAPTIYKHAGCTVKHRTLEAAASCRNR